MPTTRPSTDIGIDSVFGEGQASTSSSGNSIPMTRAGKVRCALGARGRLRRFLGRRGWGRRHDGMPSAYVTILTVALRNAEIVTVTCTNSGGAATSVVNVTATSSSTLGVDRAASPANNNDAITGYDLRYSAHRASTTTVLGIAGLQCIPDLLLGTLYHTQTRAVNGIREGLIGERERHHGDGKRSQHNSLCRPAAQGCFAA